MELQVSREHPILIIGGTGLVGWGLTQGLKAQLGTDCIKVAARHGPEVLDILDGKSLKQAIARLRPSLIIHLAAMTDVNGCERDPILAWQVNVNGTINVVKAAAGIPVVYFSTDFVFDGESEVPYQETALPHPISIYGLTKVCGEDYLEDNPGLVLRISFPWYSVSQHLAQPKLKDTLWWMAQEMVNGHDVPAFTNVSGSWTEMSFLVAQFWRLVQTALALEIKLVHFACADTATAFEIAEMVHAHLQQLLPGKSLGQPIATKLVDKPGEIALRPPKGGLSTKLLADLGFPPSSVADAIRNRWLDEIPSEWQD